jgi:hypothetical protein
MALRAPNPMAAPSCRSASALSWPRKRFAFAGYEAVMVSFTFSTSALSANGFGRKANCSFYGRLLSKASSA